MKQISYLFLILMFISPDTLIAQNTIIGKVLDKKTKQSIANANIQLADSQIGTVTNEEGIFHLELPSFPNKLHISHVSYHDKNIRLLFFTADTLIVYLKPQVAILEPFTIAANQLEPLSDGEAYSVIDFEIINHKIIRLEYHGSFKSHRLSISKLNGEVVNETVLKGVKQIEGLYLSCDETVYLFTSSKAYPILSKQQLELGEPITRVAFNDFVLPCKAALGLSYYYLLEEENGLKTKIVEVDKISGDVQIIKVIADDKRITQYKEDHRRIMKALVGKSKMRASSLGELRRMRDLQNEAIFIKQILYKPDYPIFLWVENEQLALYNLPELRIEANYKGNNTWSKVADIQYLPNKKWMKQLLRDPVTNQKYNIYEDTKGIKVALLDKYTGRDELINSVSVHPQKIRKIRTYNNELYLLKEVAMDSRKIELVKRGL